MPSTEMGGGIPRPVRLLGWVSLLTDAATEMIYPLLPVYLSRVLGVGALALGIIEGVAEAINSVLKVAAGWTSDRWTRRKPIVMAGYALSSFARPFIALTTSWTDVLAIRALDRTGKGIRGAPRDAMLAEFATPASRGRIFGFHRAMDHTGAVVGPLLAAAILFLVPDSYRLVFGLTLVPGLLAVVMLTYVPEEARVVAAPRPEAYLEVGRQAPLPSRLWLFMGILFVFSLGNSSDAFLLLRLGEALGSAAYVPLLWAALHVVKASLSTWGGGLSDRFGRRRIIAAGWAVYAAVYLGFATAHSPAVFVAWFLAYGVFFALTEGAEKALVADLAPTLRRGTAFGVYNAVLGGGALAASVVFGLVYDRIGASAAFAMSAALAGSAAVLLAFVPVRVQS